MTNLIGVYEGSPISSGIFPSLPDRSALLWQDGRNMVFRNGSVANSLGQFRLFAPVEASPILGALEFFSGSTKYVVFGTRSKLYIYNATAKTVTEISNTTPYTPITSGVWQLKRWGTWVVASNGIDPVQVWKGSGRFIDLAGTPFTYAKVIETNDTHLFAFNTSSGANMLHWSDLDDIEDWTATSTNQAGRSPHLAVSKME